MTNMNWIPQKIAIRESLLNLLIEEKKDDITVRCGLKALDQIMQMPEFMKTWDEKSLHIADCWIHVTKDFDLDPWEIWYNDVIVFE